MSIHKVKSALVKGFTDANLVSVERVAWENKAFTPPADGFWASVFFLPAADTPVATLGPTGRDEASGVLQIDLNYPTGNGDKDAGEMADSVRALFKAGSRFPFSGIEVIVSSSGRSPGRVVGNYWRVSVSVYFYSHINR